MIRTFFRIVQSNPSTERDFASRARLGLPVVNSVPPELHSGVPVYATLTQAVNTMQRFPSTGRWVAVLELDDEKFRVERTLRNRGHHTVWAEPAFLLESVVEVREPPALAPRDR